MTATRACPIDATTTNEPNADITRDPLASRVRAFLALFQGVSIVLTWRLWQARSGDQLPNVSLIDPIPQFDVGWLMLLSLVPIPFAPRWGAICHAAMLAFAIVQDEARLQPEFISIAIMMAATIGTTWSRELGRFHLAALWFWAGLHKLLSEGYWDFVGPAIAEGIWPSIPQPVAFVVSAVIAVGELALGIAALSRRTGRVPFFGALVVHLAALLWLVVHRHNQAVWPWQVAALVTARYVFCDTAGRSQTANELEQKEVPTSGRWRWIAWGMMLYPALYYANLMHPYLAWCLYAGNTPDAVWFAAPVVKEDGLPVVDTRGKRLVTTGLEQLNVPYIAMPSTCRRLLNRFGKVDEAIMIDDPRFLSRWQSRRVILFTKTAAGVNEESVDPGAMQRDANGDDAK